MISIPDSILSQPLLFLESALPAFCQRFAMLRERTAAMQSTSGAAMLTIADFVNQRRPYEVKNGVALIHVNDALAQNTAPIDRMLGMTDYAHIAAELDQAVGDPAVTAIVLDISSPGGSAIGAPEAASAVANAAQTKPVVSYIGDVGASAAYYLAAASSAIFTQPSGMVGSIGTRMQFLDFASMAAAAGITPHIFTPAASDLKAAGNAVRSPTPAETSWLQSHVETINAGFTAWVQQHRPAAAAAQMRGQVFTGAEAATNGLADYIGTLADAVAAAADLTRLNLTTLK